MTTEEFIAANASADVERLAFQKDRYPDVDMRYALEQIEGRQTARRKLPSWASREGIVYPPRLSMEQCSSEATARYKAGVMARLAARHEPQGRSASLVDLTGGFGVDFSFMASGFSRAVYVERSERLCAVARHNFPLLGLSGAQVVHGDAEAFLSSMEPATAVFLDPARRDSAGGRTVAIADCTPDVLAMRDALAAKAGVVMLKLSPMLGWHKAASDLGRAVSEVHIVASGGECKELLMVMERGCDMSVPAVFCSDCGAGSGETDAAVFAVDPDMQDAVCPVASSPREAAFLYVPDASVMKSGCFGALARRFGVEAVAQNSHLFVSREAVAGFPGRGFSVSAVTPVDRRKLMAAMDGAVRANVAVRNFPMAAEQLRRKLRLKDGGDDYVFATTAADGSRMIFLCRKC